MPRAAVHTTDMATLFEYEGCCEAAHLPKKTTSPAGTVGCSRRSSFETP